MSYDMWESDGRELRFGASLEYDKRGHRRKMRILRKRARRLRRKWEALNLLQNVRD